MRGVEKIKINGRRQGEEAHDERRTGGVRSEGGEKSGKGSLERDEPSTYETKGSFGGE